MNMEFRSSAPPETTASLQVSKSDVLFCSLRFLPKGFCRCQEATFSSLLTPVFLNKQNTLNLRCQKQITVLLGTSLA
jgi:hypothetical protein